jgi:large subunit ribosomal protein L25
MSEVFLNAEVRAATGKKAKRVRRNGQIPGVFYAHGEGNISIQVPAPSLEPLIYTTETHIINLKLVDGTMKKCILRDVQFDPVTDKPIHFDLQGLKEHEKLTIEVPVVITGGTPIGVREGGMLQIMIHKVKVSCLPKDIPEKIEVNVADLGMNKFVHVRELNVSPDVSVLADPESAVVGVVPPTIHKEPEPTAVAEEAMKEPEVLGKGKKAEEGEEGAASAAAPAEKKDKAPEEKKK